MQIPIKSLYAYNTQQKNIAFCVQKIKEYSRNIFSNSQQCLLSSKSWMTVQIYRVVQKMGLTEKVSRNIMEQVYFYYWWRLDILQIFSFKLTLKWWMVCLILHLLRTKSGIIAGGVFNFTDCIYLTFQYRIYV